MLLWQCGSVSQNSQLFLLVPSGAGPPTRPHLCPCSSTGERPTHPGDVVWCKPRPGQLRCPDDRTLARGVQRVLEHNIAPAQRRESRCILDGWAHTIGVPTRIKRLRPVERAEEESTYMPSARAETQPAAMGTAERAWRLNTASRLQPGNRKNDVSSCLLNPELRQVARNRESSERAALFMVVWGSTPRKASGWVRRRK